MELRASNIDIYNIFFLKRHTKLIKKTRFKFFKFNLLLIEMKTIVLLCGVGEVGKTKTLKSFFSVKHTRRLGRMQLLQRVLNGKKIYAVSLSSPQEQEGFCQIDKVKANIERRIQKCEQASQGQDYFLIIPFGIYRRNGRLNENCILKPIEWLRNQGFKVSPIYLKKMRAVDLLMKRITSNEIESTIEYDRQSRDLENFIKAI